MQQIARNWMIRVLIGAVFVLSLAHTPARAGDPTPPPSPSPSASPSTTPDTVLEKRDLTAKEALQFQFSCEQGLISNAGGHIKTAGSFVYNAFTGNYYDAAANLGSLSFAGIEITTWEPICNMVKVVSIGLGWVACSLLYYLVDPVFSVRVEKNGKVTKEGSCGIVPKVTQMKEIYRTDKGAPSATPSSTASTTP